MPADPLTGLLSSEDEALVTNYLGFQTPVSTKGQPTLPVGGAPVTGGAGPVAPGGTGVATEAMPGTPAARGAARPDDKGLAMAKLGTSVAEKLGNLIPGSEPTRGDTGQQSLSDVIRSGGSLPSLKPTPEMLGPSGRFGEAPTGGELGLTFEPDASAASGAVGAEAATAEAAAPAAEGAGISLGGVVGPALAGVGAGLDIYGRSKGRMPAGQQAGEAAVEAAGVAAAPFTLGLSAIAAPLVNMAIEEIASAGANYAPTRRKAYSQLTQGLQGGFAPSLQEAVGKGPEAVQKLLTPENLKEFGLEVQRDPQTGEYTVGLSSAGHPYIKYTDALNAQTQLSQAVNQALQVSRAFQLAQPPAEAPAAAPAPAPAPVAAPPVTPAGGGPLGLAEIGLEVGQ